MILGLLTSRLAGPGFAVLAALLLAALVPVGCDNARLKNQVAAAWAARDKAEADLSTCQASRRSLEGSLAAQNAALAAKATSDAQRLAAAEKALSEAARGRSSAEARAAKLLRPIAGADACARMEAADAAVMETLR